MLEKSVEVVVSCVRALMEPTIAIYYLRESMISLRTGHEVDLDDLAHRLARLGYRRVPVVEEVGDFALRGGLIDFFTPGSDAPIRVELLGDEVETIREFDVATQRTLKRVDSVRVLPRRETPITQETLESHLETLPEKDADLLRARYLNDPELPGLEWLAVLFGLGHSDLLDYFDSQGIIYMQGEGSLKSEAEAIIKEAHGLRDRLKDRFTVLPQPEEYYQEPESLFSAISTRTTIDQVPFRGGRKDIVDFGCLPHPSRLRGSTRRAAALHPGRMPCSGPAGTMPSPRPLARASRHPRGAAWQEVPVPRRPLAGQEPREYQPWKRRTPFSQ